MADRKMILTLAVEVTDDNAEYIYEETFTEIANSFNKETTFKNQKLKMHWQEFTVLARYLY